MFWCSSEQNEMVKVIYKIADNVKGHDPNTEEEDTDAETHLEAQQTGKNTSWSRWSRLIVVLLCVLLLTAITMLWILKTENNQLQTSNNNLTIEREQLQGERAELQKFLELGWTYYNSSVYNITKAKKRWTESRQDCSKTGADLVIINSTEEQEFVNKLLGNERVWIGLSDRDTEGEWKWVDNTTLITGFWGDGKPNGTAGDEDCVIAGATADPVNNWGDDLCNNEYMWICEKTIFN